MFTIHHEPNWVYEAASCLAKINQDKDENMLDEDKKFGMTREEMEDYFSNYDEYKEAVISELRPIYDEYPHLGKYFQGTDLDNLITTVAGFLTFFIEDISTLKNDREGIDRIVNKSMSSLLDEHLKLPEDLNLEIRDLASLLDYLENVELEDKTKLLLISLYNNRYEVLGDLAELINQCIPILKAHFNIIEDDFKRALTSLGDRDKLNSFMKDTINVQLDIPEKTVFYFSIFNSNQISIMESHEDKVISYIGIFVEDLIKLTEKNKFNDTRILSDLKAISDPTRLRIIGLLSDKKMYLQEIAEALELAPSTISHHIQILLNTMLVSVTVDAMNSRKIFYETNKDKVKELGESIKNLVSNNRY